MKSGILMIATSLVVLCSCNSEPKYKVSGSIDGVEGSLYLLVDNVAVDSTEAKEGKFTFNGSVAEPDLVVLATEQESYGAFFLENAELVIAKSDNGNGVTASGSKANEAFTSFTAEQAPLIEKFNSPETSQQQRADIQQQHKALLQRYIDNNVDNIMAPFLISMNASEAAPDDTEAAVSKLLPKMQQSKYALKAKEIAATMKKTSVGQPYIEVEMPDASGEMLKLSSFVGPGKYVLLDFWASWCSPCMMEVPALVKAYSTYKAKGFEIYGVSLDKDRDAWQQTIKDNKMMWIQTGTLQGWDNSAVSEYAVRGIPANFLISPEGIIVAKSLRGEELENKLKELMK